MNQLNTSLMMNSIIQLIIHPIHRNTHITYVVKEARKLKVKKGGEEANESMDLFVTLRYQNQLYRTTSIRSSHPKWEQSFTL